MSDALQRLYPPPPASEELSGLYLRLPLEEAGVPTPFVYANFVASLDGRIALVRDGAWIVPETVANARDWRLFQELAARADCLLTSGRYLRDLEAGRAQDLLPLSADPEFADLHRYRAEAGLAPHPDVAVVSASLDFTLPRRLFEQGRRVWLLTTEQAPAARLEAQRRAGAGLAARAPGAEIPGAVIREALGGLGYRRIYSATGPYVTRTLLAGGALDALYLTTRLRLLGGEEYATIVEGAELADVGLKLRWLYLDEPGEQLFARYDTRTQPGAG